jgi:hypothetical protein
MHLGLERRQKLQLPGKRNPGKGIQKRPGVLQRKRQHTTIMRVVMGVIYPLLCC